MSSDEEIEEDPIYVVPHPIAIEKTKLAATIANQALHDVLVKIRQGAKIIDLCVATDEFIISECAKHYKKKKEIQNGIAFPTCISVNHIAGHFCPNKDDATVLSDGDVVKIDLGVHIDGHPSCVAHTVVVTTTSEPIRGPKADVICAAYYAGEAAIRLMRPGNTNSQVSQIISDVAREFGISVVEGVLSHRMRRYQLDGQETIISAPSADNRVETVEFGATGELWCLDIMMTTGSGKMKLSADARNTVFKRNYDMSYNLKQATSRNVLNALDSLNNMTFCQRDIIKQFGPKALLALKEMRQHEMIIEYPVLEDKKGEFVAQFKFSVLITANKTQKLNVAPLPFVTSEKKIENEEINRLLKNTL